MSQPQPDRADYIEFIPASTPATPLSFAKLPAGAGEGDAQSLLEQLQQTIRSAERERDSAVQQLAQAAQQITTLRDSETHLRSQFVEVTSLIQERDAAMQESDRRSRELADAARKLENATRERQETVRQRDEALRQLGAAERAPSEPVRSGSDAERQIQAIRQARDDAHTQILDLQNRLARADDQISDLEYQREKSATTVRQADATAAEFHRQLEATALDRDATAKQVDELTRELDELRTQANLLRTAASDCSALAEQREKIAALEAREQVAQADAATLRQELELVGEQLTAVTGERDGALVSLQAAQEQLGHVLREHAILRTHPGGTVTLEQQIVALCNHVAVLEANGQTARSGQADLAVLQTRFEKRRLETIDLATRLQTAQREIRDLSASLAEARLQVKFATAATRPTSSFSPASGHAAMPFAPKPEPASLHSETSAWEDEKPIAGIGKTLTEKDARSVHGAMRQCFHSFTKTPEDLSLLNELYCHVHGFAEHARASGYVALHRVCSTFSDLTRGLYEVPEQINSSTLRTIQQTIEFLGTLLRNHSFEVARDPAKAHVLAVDDDAENCASIQMAMESASLRTTCVPDSASALAKLASHSYDLIVLDVRMPGMDGFELCHQIRELPQHASTPIIFLTGLATPEHREQSMLSGGSDFIGKPFKLHELTLKTMTLILKNQLGLS
jgi:CheY-like chemotaxis protein/predicted  nucleic acid-binding Zn-ribbon protein